MSAISKEKYYSSPLPSLSCKSIIHPSTGSCIKSTCDMVLITIMGSSKFYLLVYLIRAASKWKKIDEKLLKAYLKAYIRSVFHNALFSLNLFGSLCLARTVFRRFYYYNLVFSGAFAGTALFSESQENRAVNTAISLNLVIETLLRSAIGKVDRPILKKTLLFMLCSGSLMYLLETQNDNIKGFNLWFYYPKKKKIEPNDQVKGKCVHKELCRVYIFQGFLNYLTVGYIFQFLKYLLPRLQQVLRNPLQLSRIVGRKSNVLFGLFLGVYVGIYRAASCLLGKVTKGASPSSLLLPGFLAGSAYLLNPTFSVLAVALGTTVQLWAQQIDWISNLKSTVPSQEIIFMMSIAFILHIRFMFGNTCPQQAKNVLDLSTNGRVNEIYQRFVQAFSTKT